MKFFFNGLLYSVTDPDLQIREGGGGEGGGLQKLFRPFGPQFGLKIRGGPGGGPGPTPGSATVI